MTDKVHDELEIKLLAFLRGELSQEEADQLRRQIEENQHVSDRLEHLLFHQAPLHDTGGAVPSLSEAQQAAILRRGRWKNRLLNSGFSIGVALLLGFAVPIANSVVNSFFYEDLRRITVDMIHFTLPGISEGGGSTQNGLLSQEMRIDLREQVGGDRQSVGYFENRSFFTLLSAKPQWNNGHRRLSLYFRYPLQQTVSKQHLDAVRDPAWKTLEKLPEGTVAQLAISFDRLMTHDEYYQMISHRYNLDTVWFAVDTGQEKNGYEEGMPNLLLGSGEVWGYAEGQLDYGPAPIMVNGESDRRVQAYLSEMKFLSEHESDANKVGSVYLFRGPSAKIKERYHYLQQNGVRLYGAVVTGPTKELLKLKREPGITAAFVGKVDFWNWDNPSSSGSQFVY